MALTFKLDDKQLQELRQQHAEQIEATNNLSDNLSKWLALLVETLGGHDDGQARIDAAASGLKSSTDTLDDAVQQHNKGAK